MKHQHLVKLSIESENDKSAPKSMAFAKVVALIGRGAHCHLAVKDSQMSAVHCLIALTPRGVCIQDHQSRNGTYLNGQSIGQLTPLKVGDTITAGGTTMVVQSLLAEEAIQQLLSDSQLAEIFTTGFEWLMKNIPHS